MSSRPSTAASGRVPPTTASRTRSSLSSRSASRTTTAIGPSSATPVAVADRPTTQHGLGGPKTAARPSQRLVQDRSYFAGILRSKITELNNEIAKLTREGETVVQEQSAYRIYEKQAATLAQELKNLQDELVDYNMLVDKMTMDLDIEDVNRECNELKASNERESKVVVTIFANRHTKEAEIARMEEDIQKERLLEENLIVGMPLQLKEKYNSMKMVNASLQEEMSKLQQEIDKANEKKEMLEDEIASSKTKQEVVGLCKQIRELENRRNDLLEEEHTRGTPAQESAKLLQQVKEDNQEIATMEKRIVEIREQISKIQQDINQLEEDIDESRSERSHQYIELRKREATMDKFLEEYDATKSAENSRQTTLEQSIVSLLEKISRGLILLNQLPNVQEYSIMKDDLQFKEGEMEKSKSTALSLVEERKKLTLDLQKMDNLENKIRQEMDTLKTKIQFMEEQISIYSNIDALRASAMTKEKQLHERLRTLTEQRDMFKLCVSQLQERHDSLKKQLNDNEAHIQLCNLEKKWQHLEQNNYAVRDFVAAKLAEANYKPIAQMVEKEIRDYNAALQESLSKR